MNIDINRMRDEAEAALISGNPKEGAEALQEIAFLWARAGLSKASFGDFRQHIIQEAEAKTSKAFIKERLIVAEQTLRSERNVIIQ